MAVAFLNDSFNYIKYDFFDNANYYAINTDASTKIPQAIYKISRAKMNFKQKLK